MKRDDLVKVYFKDKDEPTEVLAMEVIGLDDQGLLDRSKSSKVIKAAKDTEDLVVESEKAKIQEKMADKRAAKAKKTAKGRDMVDVEIDGKPARVYKEEADVLKRAGKLGGKPEEKPDAKEKAKEAAEEAEAKKKLIEGLGLAEKCIKEGRLEGAEEILAAMDPDKVPEKVSTALKEAKEAAKNKPK